MNTALLIIDIQNDYFPGGAMELVGADAAAERAASVLAAFRARRLPVVHVQHLSVRSGATFFRPGTPGAEIHPLVAPLAGETVVQKHYPNAFRETGLLEHLRGKGIERLVIMGMMTHMCIDTSTRAAADSGFECVLVHDACATRNLSYDGYEVPAAQVQTAFVAALNGTFAKVQSAQLAAGV
ncbi:MAG: cysteine hydrolase [Burkholderiaceae bacterium]|nr:cysteine hydrolase [Burkholderiaceae bacterium]